MTGKTSEPKARKRRVDITAIVATLYATILLAGAASHIFNLLFLNQNSALFDLFAGRAQTLRAYDYTEKRFSKISAGMTQKQVVWIVGEPLGKNEYSSTGKMCREYEEQWGRAKSQLLCSGPGCGRPRDCKTSTIEWSYTKPSPNATEYDSRRLIFKNGKVVKILKQTINNDL